MSSLRTGRAHAMMADVPTSRSALPTPAVPGRHAARTGRVASFESIERFATMRGARPDRGPVVRMCIGYLLLATIAAALAMALREGDEMPWIHPTPWLSWERAPATALSGALGLVIAGVVIAFTRFAVARFAWARHLHAELRPVASGLGVADIVLIACLSSLGEELLFRGLLVPWVGVPISAVLFGLAHQIKGPSRWVWVAWASVVGLAFGAVFSATGSLVGPLLAHALINARNLVYLRDHDPRAPSAGEKSPA